MSEGHSFLRRYFELQFVSFQDNERYLPVAGPEERKMQYCDNPEEVKINGTCFKITAICESSQWGEELVR